MLNGCESGGNSSTTGKSPQLLILNKNEKIIPLTFLNLNYFWNYEQIFKVAIYLPEVTFKELPLIIFGSTTFIAAVLSLWLPETLGSPLVESLDEIYLLHKYSKPLFSWWSKEQINQNIEKINALSTRRRPSRVSQSHSSEK